MRRILRVLGLEEDQRWISLWRQATFTVFQLCLVSLIWLLVLATCFCASSGSDSAPKQDDAGQSFSLAFKLLLTTFYGSTWGYIIPSTTLQRLFCMLAAATGNLSLPLLAAVLVAKHSSWKEVMPAFGIFLRVHVLNGIVIMVMAWPFALHPSPSELHGQAHSDYFLSWYYLFMSYHHRSYGEFNAATDGSEFLTVAATILGSTTPVICAAMAVAVFEDKRKQAVEEKVLRFEAEFKHDLQMNGLPRHQQIPACDGESGIHQKTASVNSWQSAPAVLLHPDAAAPCLCNGDCLSPECLLWVQGSAQPKALKSIKVGEEVLCFDHICQNLKFAEITGIGCEEGRVGWTTVTLEDGTSLEMTADHPMKPSDLRRVGAAELRPGQDSLKVLKVVSVPVKTVETVEETRDYMSLVVAQAERYGIFVASGSQAGGAKVQTMAVESGNLPLFTFGIQHTFLEDLSVEVSSRAHSAPPSIDPGSLDAYPSVGSLRHSQGDCKICAHQNRCQHYPDAKPCIHGAACSFCHEWHENIRHLKRQERKKAHL